MTVLEGQKLSRFSRFFVIFVKVYAFGNSKSSKRESFGYFSKRESFFIHKMFLRFLMLLQTLLGYSNQATRAFFSIYAV